MIKSILETFSDKDKNATFSDISDKLPYYTLKFQDLNIPINFNITKTLKMLLF